MLVRVCVCVCVCVCKRLCVRHCISDVHHCRSDVHHTPLIRALCQCLPVCDNVKRNFEHAVGNK